MSGGAVGLRGSRRLVRAPSVGPSPWEHVVEAHYGLNAETQMLWQGAAAANLACQYASWSPKLSTSDAANVLLTRRSQAQARPG